MYIILDISTTNLKTKYPFNFDKKKKNAQKFQR